MDYKRYENESEEELIYRVCMDKEMIGTWEDVAEILNKILNYEYTSSKYRKQYQAFQKMLEANQSKFTGSDKQLEEIKEQQRELEKERRKLSDERIEYNKSIREEARKESYADMVKRIICENVKPIDFNIDTNISHTDKDILVHLSDIHTGIEINEFNNVFNQDVLKQRLEKYTEEIVKIGIKQDCENCYIVIGEIISGIIHNNLRLQNNMDMMEQFKYISEIISQMLVNIANNFNKVNVYVTMGNHSRISPKKEDSLQGENMDILLPFYLRAKLQNIDNIEIFDNNIEQSIAMFNIRGNNIFASHGDLDNPQTVVQNWTMMFGIKPNIVLLGHRHTNGLSTVYDTKVIQSGCVSGSDKYALSIRKTNKAEQTISIIDENGLVCVYDIKLN